MGQRLVVSIIRDDEPIASVYYHWSGYTESSYEVVKKLIKVLDAPYKSDKDRLLGLIRYVEDEGGCITGRDGELEYVQSLYPDEIFRTDGSRNDGLIDLSSEGIESSIGWAEVTADIDLDSRTASVPVWDIYDSLVEKAECYGEPVDSFDPVYAEAKIDIEMFSFDEAETMYQIVCSMPSSFYCNGYLYEKIE